MRKRASGRGGGVTESVCCAKLLIFAMIVDDFFVDILTLFRVVAIFPSFIAS